MSGIAALEITALRQIVSGSGHADRFLLRIDDTVCIDRGGFVGVFGATGSGKSTLLSVLGLLRGRSHNSSLESWTITLRDGTSVNGVDLWRSVYARRASQLRQRHFGFALQDGELVPFLTVRQNLEFPLRLNGWKKSAIRQRIEELIDGFDLYRTISDSRAPARIGSLVDARVTELSGGQYQRVALARAVAHRPDFVFVDEPTASLNRQIARKSLDRLTTLTGESEFQSTVIMVTHDTGLAREFCSSWINVAPVTDECPAGLAVQCSALPEEGQTDDPEPIIAAAPACNS